VAGAGHSPQAGTWEDQVQADLVAIVKDCEWQMRATAIAMGSVMLIGVVVVWVVVSWRQSPAHLLGAVGLTLVCLVAGGVLAIALDNAVRASAVARFNLRFREGNPARPLALEMLTGLDSPYQAAQKIRTALGVPLGPEVAPEAAVQAALDQLAPAPPAAVHSAPADPSPLHLSPDTATPGKDAADFLPLEVKDRPAPAAPQQPESTRLRIVPLQPLEKPADEKPS
jgi:hypothetical protein